MDESWFLVSGQASNPYNGCVLLLPRTAPERSRLVSSRFFSTSERFASRFLTLDETSPNALTLLRPKRVTKRIIATPTSREKERSQQYWNAFSLKKM